MGVFGNFPSPREIGRAAGVSALILRERASGGHVAKVMGLTPHARRWCPDWESTQGAALRVLGAEADEEARHFKPPAPAPWLL